MVIFYSALYQSQDLDGGDESEKERTGLSKHEVIPSNDGTPVMVLSSAHVSNNTNRPMNILRKDANNQDPPMLVDGVYDALLYSTRIHCFSGKKAHLFDLTRRSQITDI